MVSVFNINLEGASDKRKSDAERQCCYCWAATAATDLNEAQRKRGVLTLMFPIAHRIFTNWDGMEDIWHHIFFLHFAHGCARGTSRLVHEEALFEPQGLLTVYDADHGRDVQRARHERGDPVCFVSAFPCTTGIVRDSGNGMSHTFPTFKDYALLRTTFR